MSEIVKGILRAVSTGLQIPTIIILILLILLTIFMLGTFFAEMLTERKSLKLNIPKLVDELQGKSTSEMKDIVASSSLLTRQKAAAQELISRVTYPDDTREALARQLIADEESRYNRIIKITDLTARVAPMFGLMGTLIPLGPGLIALSEGDAATLSSSILIAFDTTVAGLISGALSYIVSGFRKGWYEEYMIGLETIMETILDVQSTERRKAMQQKKAADAAKTGQTVSRNTVAMSREQMQQTLGQRPAPQAAPAPVQTAPQARPAAPAPAHPAPAQPAQQVRPAQQPQINAARPAAPVQPTRAEQITAKPSYTQSTSKTIAGYDAQQLQAEVRAAEAAMQKSENAAAAQAAIEQEMQSLSSLDDLLESFAPTEGRQ